MSLPLQRVQVTCSDQFSREAFNIFLDLIDDIIYKVLYSIHEAVYSTVCKIFAQSLSQLEMAIQNDAHNQSLIQTKKQYYEQFYSTLQLNIIEELNEIPNWNQMLINKQCEEICKYNCLIENVCEMCQQSYAQYTLAPIIKKKQGYSLLLTLHPFKDIYHALLCEVSITPLLRDYELTYFVPSNMTHRKQLHESCLKNVLFRFLQSSIRWEPNNSSNSNYNQVTNSNMINTSSSIQEVPLNQNYYNTMPIMNQSPHQDVNGQSPLVMPLQKMSDIVQNDLIENNVSSSNILLPPLLDTIQNDITNIVSPTCQQICQQLQHVSPSQKNVSSLQEEIKTIVQKQKIIEEQSDDEVEVVIKPSIPTPQKRRKRRSKYTTDSN